MSLAPARPLGRPRDPACDARILDAALDLLAEHGYDGLTMEAVAARAGVGKATLYRRHAAKDGLVVDALATLTEPPAAVRGRGLRDELVALLQATTRKTGSRAGRLMPRLVSAAVDHPDLLLSYRERVITPARKLFVTALQRGVDSGELRADLDLERAVDLLVGPVLYRALLWPDQAAAPAGQVVDALLAGLTTPSRA